MSLTDDLQTLIQDNKPLLLDWLTAANDPAPPPPQIECEAAPLDAVRVRDDHNDPAHYNPETGDHFGLPQKRTRYQRQTADAWVAQRLPSSGRAWALNPEGASYD